MKDRLLVALLTLITAAYAYGLGWIAWGFMRAGGPLGYGLALGVVILLAKFCDPEEFEAPLVTKALKEAGVPVITIEVDQSTESYEQARTQLETFAEIIG